MAFFLLEAAPKVGASGNAGEMIIPNKSDHIRPHGGLQHDLQHGLQHQFCLLAVDLAIGTP